MNVTTEKKNLERIHSMRREIEKLKDEITKLLSPADPSREASIHRIRQIQKNPQWIRQVREQYTEEVSRRTMELNEEFPLRPE